MSFITQLVKNIVKFSYNPLKEEDVEVINYVDEFKRIADIAKKYWKTYNSIALGVLMVDHGIRNAYYFYNPDSVSIQSFIEF